MADILFIGLIIVLVMDWNRWLNPIGRFIDKHVK